MTEKKDENLMTLQEFRRLPRKESWNEYQENIGCVIVLPIEVNTLEVFKFKILRWLGRRIKWIKEPEDWDLPRGIHDSGYRQMEFVLTNIDGEMFRVGGASDVIHIDGIGGRGRFIQSRLFERDLKYTCQDMNTCWSVDCLQVSGLLRFFSTPGPISTGPTLSSFEIFTEPLDRIQ